MGSWWLRFRGEDRVSCDCMEYEQAIWDMKTSKRNWKIEGALVVTRKISQWEQISSEVQVMEKGYDLDAQIGNLSED